MERDGEKPGGDAKAAKPRDEFEDFMTDLASFMKGSPDKASTAAVASPAAASTATTTEAAAPAASDPTAAPKPPAPAAPMTAPASKPSRPRPLAPIARPAAGAPPSKLPSLAPPLVPRNLGLPAIPREEEEDVGASTRVYEVPFEMLKAASTTTGRPPPPAAEPPPEPPKLPESLPTMPGFAPVGSLEEPPSAPGPRSGSAPIIEETPPARTPTPLETALRNAPDAPSTETAETDELAGSEIATGGHAPPQVAPAGEWAPSPRRRLETPADSAFPGPMATTSLTPGGAVEVDELAALALMRRPRRRLLWLLAVAVACGAAGVLWWETRPRPVAPPPFVPYVPPPSAETPRPPAPETPPAPADSAP